MNWLWVALGGAIGSVARYAVSQWIPYQPGRWPMATLSVNLLGCLAIGLLWGLNERSGFLTPPLRQLLVIGLLGGFTTFSSFGAESLDMLRSGETSMMIAYILASTGLGVCMAWVGFRCVGWFS